MALDFPLGLAALRLAVNPARFTKTRVCLSCFGYKLRARGFSPRPRFVQVASALQILGKLQVFQFSDGLPRYVSVLFPLHPFVSLVLCFSSAVQADPRTPPHTMRLANESDLTALASVSSSRPPNSEFVAAANLFLNLFFVCMQVMACPRDCACHLCVAD